MLRRKCRLARKLWINVRRLFALKFCVRNVLRLDESDAVEIEQNYLCAFIRRLALVGANHCEAHRRRDVFRMKRLAHVVDERLAAIKTNRQAVAIEASIGRRLARCVHRAIANERCIVRHAGRSAVLSSKSDGCRCSAGRRVSRSRWLKERPLRAITSMILSPMLKGKLKMVLSVW